MPMVRLELATLGYKPSALAIELTSSKAIAGKELSLSNRCIASLYIWNSRYQEFLCPVEPLYFSVPRVPVSSRTTVPLGTRSSCVQ